MKKQTFFIILIILMALAIGMWREQGHRSTAPLLSLVTGTLLSSPQHLPSFTLEDHDGTPFTCDSLKKHWSILFFGYTACPNICPTTIASLQDVAQRLSRLPMMQYIFITLDPDVDDKKQLQHYFKRTDLHHKILGVTGEKKAILSLSKQLGVHVEENKDEKNINHSGSLFLIDPNGNLTALFTDTTKPSAIAHDIKEIIHYRAFQKEPL